MLEALLGLILLGSMLYIVHRKVHSEKGLTTLFVLVFPVPISLYIPIYMLFLFMVAVFGSDALQDKFFHDNHLFKKD